MTHFEEIVKRLSRDDLSILNSLFVKDAVNKFQSMDKAQIAVETGLGEYALRKTIERLELLMFIEVTKVNRFYHFYLTDFGISAIQLITEGVEV